jgi:hypothetical protein
MRISAEFDTTRIIAEHRIAEVRDLACVTTQAMARSSWRHRLWQNAALIYIVPQDTDSSGIDMYMYSIYST